MTFIDVNEADFEAKVVEGSRSRPVVVDFWADWCQPCHILSPVLERLAEEYGERFLLAKVDVDANPTLSQRFGIQGIPAVKAFRDGEVAAEFVGVQPEPILRRFLDEVVPSQVEPLLRSAAESESLGDVQTAEASYRDALATDPSSTEAILGLARVLLVTDRTDEARDLLAKVEVEPGARPLLAELALRDLARPSPGEGEGDPLLTAAARAALSGDHRGALDRTLEVVAGGGEAREQARKVMVHVFDLLGEEHPLVGEYRPRLASALY